jgi:hypothetical protein
MQVRHQPVARVGNDCGREERCRPLLLESGQETVEPVAEHRGIQDARHQLGLRQGRREEVASGGLPGGGVVPVLAEPAARGVGDRGEELRRARPGTLGRVRQREGEPECAIRVRTVALRIARLRQPLEEAGREHVRQRAEIRRPPGRVRVVPVARLEGELQRPAPTVGALEDAVCLEVRRLRGERRRGQVDVEPGADLCLGHALRQRPQQAQQRPVISTAECQS